MATKIKVGGELASVAVDEKLVDAIQVKDESRQNKSQKAINDELANSVDGKINKTDIVEEVGDSTEKVMSQRVVTSILRDKFDKTAVKAVTGASTTDTMSQKAITEELAKKQITLKAGTGISIAADGTIKTTLDVGLYKVVSALPTTGIDTNKIYLVPDAEGQGQNVYVEYMYVNSKWEIVGQYKSDVDLTPYFKKEDIQKKTEVLSSSADDKVPSSALLYKELAAKAEFAGLVKGHYAKPSAIPSNAADGSYLIDANASGTSGSYIVTVASGSVVAPSEHLATSGYLYMTVDGHVYEAKNGAAWYDQGAIKIGNTWTVTKNTDDTWKGFDYMNAKAGDIVIIGSKQYVLAKWDNAGTGWLIDINAIVTSSNKAKINVKQISVNDEDNFVVIDDYDTDVTIDTELNEFSFNPVENAVITKKVNDLQSQISVIQAEKATFTVKRTSGNAVYLVGEPIDTYIQADCSITADTITISQGGAEKRKVTSAKQCIYHETKAAGATTAPTTLTYSAKAVIGDVNKTASVSISIVNPMYVGAGAAYTDVVNDSHKQSARTSASGTYNVTVASSGQHVFFVVPSSMTINKVTLSGFDFPLDTADTTSKSGYKIYKSSNTYKAGAISLVVS